MFGWLNKLFRWLLGWLRPRPKEEATQVVIKPGKPELKK